jgi:hypothetical protein
LLLWYAQTSDSDKAIGEFSGDTRKPNPSRSYANELAHRKANVSLYNHATVLTSSEASLRQTRRERMKVVSDEALIDLDSYTAKIVAKRR